MDPIVISDTIQEYEGMRYYRCGPYFQREIEGSLHRRVWEDHAGPIPPGHHVHHVDHDRTHNEFANLHLLSASEHSAHHGKDPLTPAKLAARRENVQAASAGNRLLTQAQRSAASTRGWGSVVSKTATCEQCGAEFETPFQTRSRFCSNNCKSAARRATGVDHEDRTCLICGAIFSVNRYTATVTCSKSCGARHRERGKRVIRRGTAR